MNLLMLIGGLMGLAAVGLGAFGAHGLEGKLTPDQLDWWKTATFYLLPHAIAVLWASRTEGMSLPGYLWAMGAALFAATLFALALEAPRWFGALTPIGGIMMMAGWALVVFKSLTLPR